MWCKQENRLPRYRKHYLLIMNWIPLTNESEFAEILRKSAEKPQVIFKHSTRCSISSMAKSRLDKADTSPSVDFNYLDLISYRSLSNKIADDLNVSHESPQVLLIKNGECIYDESHSGIRIDDILEQAV